jgi:hypothetical protein
MTNREWLEQLSGERRLYLCGGDDIRRLHLKACPSRIYRLLFRPNNMSMVCLGLDCRDCRPAWLARECLWPEME